MEKYKEVLQFMADEELKNAVFASFSTMKKIDKHSNPSLYQNAVSAIRNNKLFRASREKKLGEDEIYEMFMFALKKAHEELQTNFSNSLKLALNMGI